MSGVDSKYYQFFPKDTNVFEYGTPGDKFYLVLDGRLGVWVPQNLRKSILQDA